MRQGVRFQGGAPESGAGTQPALFDEECDVLWDTCAELGVPVGLHPSANHPFDQGLLDYLPGLRNCRATVSFVMGSMLACTGFIMGGVLERHPQLKLVFLESGCGWAAFWLDRLEAGIQGGTRRLRIQGLNHNPSSTSSVSALWQPTRMTPASSR